MTIEQPKENYRGKEKDQETGQRQNRSENQKFILAYWIIEHWTIFTYNTEG